MSANGRGLSSDVLTGDAERYQLIDKINKYAAQITYLLRLLQKANDYNEALYHKLSQSVYPQKIQFLYQYHLINYIANEQLLLESAIKDNEIRQLQMEVNANNLYKKKSEVMEYYFAKLQESMGQISSQGSSMGDRLQGTLNFSYLDQYPAAVQYDHSKTLSEHLTTMRSIAYSGNGDHLLHYCRYFFGLL